MNSIMPIRQRLSNKQSFPLRLFAAAFVISLLTTVFSGWQSWQMHERFEEISKKHMDIEKDIGRIMLFDEVLTMSARMAATTGDFSYEKRYDEFDPQLTAYIDDVRADLPQAEIALFIGETDEANLALVKIERQAFALAHQGKRQTATALLTGAGYMRLKEIYAGGMEKTVNAANGLIERETRQLHTLYRWAAAASAVGVLLLLAIWFFADQAVRSWGLKRREAWDEILKAREELEDRVKQRTASLLSANEQLEHEILEHKRAEERIRESEAHYHGIFEYSNDIIYLLNLNGTINSLSPAFERITGWTAEEWIGKPFAPIIHPDDLSDADTVFQKALSGESIPTFRLRLARKSGQYFDADLSITPLGHDMVMGVARDVSERTKTEAQLVEQLEELRRWHDTTLDREGRILDLKHEVNDLLSQTGKHPRYPSAESADPQENK